jgi:F0F1-type ATP synthase membrane subunit b/b'
MHAPQYKYIKKQNNCSPSKSTSTTKDLNNSEKKEISNIDFQKKPERMINKLKEETQKIVYALKEDMNKQLKELKKNSNKQISEIKKTLQDIKEELNRNPEKESF